MKNKKAGHYTSHNQNTFAGGKFKSFDAFNFKQNRHFSQCRQCGSDYMRFAQGGYCLGCQQKVEFIIREHPYIPQRRRV